MLTSTIVQKKTVLDENISAESRRLCSSVNKPLRKPLFSSQWEKKMEETKKTTQGKIMSVLDE